MKKAIIIISCLFSFSSWSQNIEVFTGINDNHFYDNVEGSHFTSTYTSDIGYTFGVAIEDVKVEWSTMRFTLRYDKYQGSINVRDGSAAGGSKTTAEIDKSILSLGVYPFSFFIRKKIQLNIGFELSKLVAESYEGSRSGYLTGQPSWNDDLEKTFNQFNSSITAGLVGRISYDIQINESLALTPQYVFYYGVSSEFKEFPKETKSLRNLISIGIKHKLN